MLLVLARLQSFDAGLEEAALDLGASHAQVMRRILLPHLYPAIGAGAAIAFFQSIENFNVTLFTRGGADTLTVYVFSKVRSGITPTINALAFLLILVTLVPGGDLRDQPPPPRADRGRPRGRGAPGGRGDAALTAALVSGARSARSPLSRPSRARRARTSVTGGFTPPDPREYFQRATACLKRPAASRQGGGGSVSASITSKWWRSARRSRGRPIPRPRTRPATGRPGVRRHPPRHGRSPRAAGQAGRGFRWRPLPRRSQSLAFIVVAIRGPSSVRGEIGTTRVTGTGDVGAGHPRGEVPACGMAGDHHRARRPGWRRTSRLVRSRPSSRRSAPRGRGCSRAWRRQSPRASAPAARCDQWDLSNRCQ